MFLEICAAIGIIGTPLMVLFSITSDKSHMIESRETNPFMMKNREY